MLPYEHTYQPSIWGKQVKRLAILQSNYLPWKGYFRIIRESDLFIFYDDVKFTKNDWRNRNEIFINYKKTWLSIPVDSKAKKLINEVSLPNSDWKEQHLRKLYEGYQFSTNFSKVFNFVEAVYFSRDFHLLSDLNKTLIKEIYKEWLAIETPFEDSTDYPLSLKKGERVLELCLQCHADVYISDPAAKTYLNTSSFVKKGIKIDWMDYSNFKKYKQGSKEFVDHISIVDLLFSVGKDAAKYL